MGVLSLGANGRDIHSTAFLLRAFYSATCCCRQRLESDNVLENAELTSETWGWRQWTLLWQVIALQPLKCTRVSEVTKNVIMGSVNTMRKYRHLRGLRLSTTWVVTLSASGLEIFWSFSGLVISWEVNCTVVCLSRALCCIMFYLFLVWKCLNASSRLIYQRVNWTVNRLLAVCIDRTAVCVRPPACCDVRSDIRKLNTYVICNTNYAKFVDMFGRHNRMSGGRNIATKHA